MTAPQNLAGVTDVAFHSMHRKGNQCKLLVVHSKTIDVVSCFTVLSGDRHHDDTQATHDRCVGSTLNGRTVEWWNGGIVEWQNGRMVNGGMVNGRMVNGGMVEWWSGRMVNGGMVEWWSGRMVEWWNG